MKILKNTTLPEFRVKTIKVLLMENAPIGSFVANFGAKNIQNITLKSNNLKLLNALKTDPKTGIIRTREPLNEINEAITIYLNGSNQYSSCEALLEINMISVSKCLPNFDSNQKLIFNITVIFKFFFH